MTGVGRDGEPAQFGIADLPTPQQQRMTGARPQNLLRSPQHLSMTGRAHQHDIAQIDAGSRQRGRKRKMRRGKPDDAPAGGRQGGQRRQNQLQLSAALGAGQDLGQRGARPAAARQPRVELREPGRQRRHNARRHAGATPDALAPEEILEGRGQNGHDGGQSLEILYFYTVSQKLTSLGP